MHSASGLFYYLEVFDYSFEFPFLHDSDLAGCTFQEPEHFFQVNQIINPTSGFAK